MEVQTRKTFNCIGLFDMTILTRILFHIIHYCLFRVLSQKRIVCGHHVDTSVARTWFGFEKSDMDQKTVISKLCCKRHDRLNHDKPLLQPISQKRLREFTNEKQTGFCMWNAI